MAQQQKIRRFVMTGAVFAITVTGALYGAGLKTQQEFKKEKKVLLQATPEERIAQLESARERLMTKKLEMERKIADVTARRIARDQKKSEGS
ncbi:hypothetical protein AOQ84DRAFT_301318 [Glonium stellatum]|uniref:Uncharacterized protein n=1 Tax=Glonium stellatum TaxID=574774 RepID=A0A8E2ESR2_9PEZI|nr:hypothetical protein AOQ84DRAFT_301318 [Glonium stellatum]